MCEVKLLGEPVTHCRLVDTDVHSPSTAYIEIIRSTQCECTACSRLTICHDLLVRHLGLTQLMFIRCDTIVSDKKFRPGLWSPGPQNAWYLKCWCRVWTILGCVLNTQHVCWVCKYCDGQPLSVTPCRLYCWRDHMKSGLGNLESPLHFADTKAVSWIFY